MNNIRAAFSNLKHYIGLFNLCFILAILPGQVDEEEIRKTRLLFTASIIFLLISPIAFFEGLLHGKKVSPIQGDAVE